MNYTESTLEERASYREYWKDSGLSKKNFCEQEGLVLATFLSWFSGLAHIPHQIID
ncbi:IS66 family insertion sequence element accessory protein TnpA [Legionella sp.]|uniref:IS66 family insertion sequence element accessory protein TnpA n=1 Tax=Legionella sp. TaxID=459 RepID=UPI003D14710D